MLLALFLHPLHVRVAVAIHKESPSLRFLERLCGYGIYYYRRYAGIANESDIEGLAADLHAWYRGVFVRSSIVQFSGDVGQYWSFAGDIRADSKLPKLAAIILSIAVNTATCERYFSELAAIHTALKNRMSIEKARKFSLIRQTIRQLDKVASEGKEIVEIKRIVAAAEREHVGNCDMGTPITLEELEENHVIAHQDVPSEDTTEYWQDILNVLDGNESILDETCIDEDDELEQNIFEGFEEAIPEPDTTEFPQTNVKTFPQETKLTGIRGQKFSLTTLFPSERTFGLTPYVTSLSA
ncbi:hAT family C-terminal dimerization region [Phytophthora infestans]|uniref:HAT family C-terminal dimerization region n=1 Tax=Phytophthora infestans TaxID=4787 RepID=A0A8S9ULQ5_PHYIN|nr:hAT family C-terminal dimerization region [Phytophthora infestans]